MYFDSYEDLLNDLTIFIQLQKSQWPQIPHFILGTGFGGLVVTKFITESPPFVSWLIDLLTSRNLFNGVIILAPPLAIPQTVGAATVTIASVAGAVVPNLSLVR